MGMRPSLNRRQWDWVAERYQEGYSMVALASFLGVHRETVRRGLIRAGARPQNRRALPSLMRWNEAFRSLGEEPEDIPAWNPSPTEGGKRGRPRGVRKREQEKSA